ncbi:conserved hypothetical protein [Neospora caninum Liverpool]|uniref:Transporter, major facilitator family protein n=1 Tax=Neospora caninum (strain Liverpool) TaxID=572307 RepID=F0VGZ8_NEOCL|nr:conserved hypothetical protein [Neospora caninum Liverpool]CBZ52992.1 conserved hypothetical protein [Neospora caninum Liverpool]CEL66977.1 TPA: transporter, major facilitator family protein [Neospora caninum Liverpool]|eukprot:XP_003883024.1 conserved hypothetical protein [Neospora caninum Liverpool]
MQSAETLSPRPVSLFASAPVPGASPPADWATHPRVAFPPPACEQIADPQSGLDATHRFAAKKEGARVRLAPQRSLAASPGLPGADTVPGASPSPQAVFGPHAETAAEKRGARLASSAALGREASRRKLAAPVKPKPLQTHAPAQISGGHAGPAENRQTASLAAHADPVPSYSSVQRMHRTAPGPHALPTPSAACVASVSRETQQRVRLSPQGGAPYLAIPNMYTPATAPDSEAYPRASADLFPRASDASWISQAQASSTPLLLGSAGDAPGRRVRGAFEGTCEVRACTQEKELFSVGHAGRRALVDAHGAASLSASAHAGASASGSVGYFPLVCMLFMSVMCNFDHGVIPAVLGDLQEHFTQMGFVEQSLLGSLVYFGLIVGTLFAGVSYQHLGAKWLLVASLTCLSAGLYVFSSSSSLAVMYIMRFCIGLCQALPVVYVPVWVDAFAPEGQVTRWMAFTQLGGIGGTVLGYFLGGVLSKFHGANSFGLAATSWRTPFVIQSVALLPLICALACSAPKTVNLPPSSYAHLDPEREGGLPMLGDGATAGGEESSAMRSVWRVLHASLKGVHSLLKNPLYVIITLGMSTLYFVVTGIQFWVTEYMVIVLKFNKITVVVLSTLCFLTAPTSGVWCGGYVCDQCGGYRGGQQRTAVRVATAFAGIAALQAVACVYVSNIFLFAGLLWGSLFAGAALVPVAVGMILSSVPVHQRSLSSAVSQFAYHVFGWFAAPLASGAVMDFVDTWQSQQVALEATKELPLAVGFSMILCVSVLGFGFFATANLLTLPSEKIEKEELELQLARSRLPTLSF